MINHRVCVPGPTEIIYMRTAGGNVGLTAVVEYALVGLKAEARETNEALWPIKSDTFEFVVKPIGRAWRGRRGVGKVRRDHPYHVGGRLRIGSPTHAGIIAINGQIGANDLCDLGVLAACSRGKERGIGCVDF